MIIQKNEVKVGKSESGFLKLLVLIVIALIVLSFLGFNIESLWSDFVFPIVETIWNILVWFANFLYTLIKVGLNSIGVIVDLINKLTGR
jgi:hypothetical protein